jgi:hypothetical protein
LRDLTAVTQAEYQLAMNAKTIKFQPTIRHIFHNSHVA